MGEPRAPEPEDRLLARRYMLGGLSVEQQDEVERRFLFDPAFEDLVLEEETDLFDALAAGTLSSDDERALRLWASARQRTQSRLATAFAFQRLTGSPAASASASEDHPIRRHPTPRVWLDGLRTPRFSALWLAGVTAASLAAIVASFWLTPTHPAAPSAASSSAAAPQPAAASPALPSSKANPAASMPSALPPAPAPARPAAVATLFLMAEETRGAIAPPVLKVKPGTTTVTLQLASQAGLSSGPHTVQLAGPGGSTIQPSTVSARRLHGQNFLEVTLDAATLPPGDYTLLLHQNDPAGPAPDLTYHFQIAAIPPSR